MDDDYLSLSHVKKFLKTDPRLFEYFEEKGEECILVKVYKKYEMVQKSLLVVWVYSINHVIDFTNFMNKCFPEFSILEKINLFLRVKVSSAYRLSQIFGQLHENKGRLDIDEYNVKQMSLEQIFLGFANEQKE